MLMYIRYLYFVVFICPKSFLFPSHERDFFISYPTSGTSNLFFLDNANVIKSIGFSITFTYLFL